MTEMVGTRRRDISQKVAGDGLGLAALFCSQAGIGAGQIDEADDGAAEFFGDFHAAKGFAVALGMGHAEVAADTFFRGAAFAVADDHDFVVAEPGHAAGDGFVVAKGAIPVNLAEIRKDSLDKVHGVWPLRMTGPLDSCPRRGNGLRLVGKSRIRVRSSFPAAGGQRQQFTDSTDSTGRGWLGQLGGQDQVSGFRGQGSVVSDQLSVVCKREVGAGGRFTDKKQ